MDEKTKNAVQSALKTAASIGIKNLLEIASTIPVVAPVAVLITQLMSVCEQAKCNKNAFFSLRGRLDIFAKFLFDLSQTVHTVDQNNSLKIAVTQLEQLVSEATIVITMYTKHGYFLHFITGNLPQKTFDKFDFQLTKALQELAFCLQVDSLKIQKQTYTVICDVKYIIEEKFGGFEAVAENPENLESLASFLQADVDSLQVELSDSIALDIVYNTSLINNLTSAPETLAPQIQQNLIEQIPSLEAGQCVWTAQSKVLGQGGFGKVYLGHYKGHEVAVKTIKNLTNERDILTLMTEVSIHHKVSILAQSPGVIRLYGADFINDDVEKRCIVMEMSDGSLHDALYNHDKLKIDLDLLSKINVMLQVAYTMVHLHELKILHRDIKPANILLICYRNHVKAKLCDFGLAKSYVDHGYSTVHHGAKGTQAYMAPELRENKYSAESDVYAYSITLNEVLSGMRPVVDAILGLRLFTNTAACKDDSVQSALLNIVHSGLNAEPALRHPFTWISKELSPIHAGFSDSVNTKPTTSNSERKQHAITFVDLKVPQVCALLRCCELEHLVTYVEKSQLSGKYLVKDCLGKTNREIVTMMSTEYDIHMHITHARELKEAIETWNNVGLPSDFRSKISAVDADSSEIEVLSTGLVNISVGDDTLKPETDTDGITTIVSESVVTCRPVCGRGQYVNSNGYKYDGEWLNSKKHGKGVMKYANGSVYDGEWLNNTMHGKGVLKCVNGIYYDGEWVDDKKHGKGVHTYADSEVYNGDWKDNKKHGKGIFTFSEGSVYDGEWMDDKPHGKGVIKYVNGDIYDGDWVKEKRQGQGVLQYADGDVYDGEWMNDQMHGQGVMENPNGDVYDGEWADGMRHGKGFMKFSNGNIYDGEWIDNKMHGKGIVKYANGDVYDGELFCGFMHGKGVMKYANGDVYDGEWRNDNMHGKGVMEYANGDVYDGEWVYNTKHGKGVMKYCYGGVYDGEWKDNKPHGKGVMKYAGGDVYDGEWMNDKLNGKGVMKYADGDVYDGEWVDHTMHGKGVYKFAIGSVYDGEWVNDRAHGKGVMKCANGDVYDGEWVDNKPHGYGVMKYANGDVYDGEWVNSERHGKGVLTCANGDVFDGEWRNDKYCKF